MEALQGGVEGSGIHQRLRTFSQVYPDDIQAAIQILGHIRNTAIVVHGVQGCSASALRADQFQPAAWYSTNLKERDTILGGDEKLRRAVIRAYEEKHPENFCYKNGNFPKEYEVAKFINTDALKDVFPDRVTWKAD
uniref:Nitrogenase molybdenum-iron protein, alpha and beta chains n=1 Tax=Eubacterium cellulosolvens (strain ATCC 43171 / JCM 9499 / 6) TaxID=633697 RepID=I5ARP8_EUBC6